MALDHHGRAWIAAIANERWDDALQRVETGRAGAWNATNRAGLNALMIAGRVGRTDLIAALTHHGARALDPSGNALQDWLERGERRLIDAYLSAVPPGDDPFPGITSAVPLGRTPVMAAAVSKALDQGWVDLADRLLAYAPTAPQHPDWRTAMTLSAQNAVFHDRPAVLDWLDAHAGLDWPAIHCPADVLSAREDGNLLVLAGYNGSTRVLPWLLDHGVPPNGDLPHANGSDRNTARPWLVALDREAAQRTDDQPWSTSWAAAWLDTWLHDPRTHAVLTERTGRFGQDLLSKLVLREDLLRIEQVLRWHDFVDPDHDVPSSAFSARWVEPLAVGTGNPRVLDRVLQRSAGASPTYRHAILKAAFERWTRDGLAVEQPDGRAPVHPDALDPQRRQAVLRVLVQHGWNLNGETAQMVWIQNRRPLACDAVLGPARAEGWSPMLSAQAWPSGPADYITLVMNALFVAGPSPRPADGPTVSVPAQARRTWADRWFGPGGWLHDALTPDTWRSAWVDATSGSQDNQRIDWAIEHIPDGILSPEEAVKGVLRWSLNHSSDPDAECTAPQTATLHRWLQRFAATIPADHPAVVKLVQQQVFDDRRDWFEACVSTFPKTVRHVSPTTGTSVPMIRRLAELGASLNPRSAFREPLVHDWLDEIHRRAQTPNQTGAQRRKAATDGNRAGLVEVLKNVGPSALDGWALHLREEGEPIIVWAARQQDWSLVDVLRRAGMDVNAQDAKGRTALSWALAQHDKPSSRAWEGYWPMGDEQDSTWNSYRLRDVVLGLLNAGARVDVTIPGKDRTVERAMANPKHQAWLRADQELWVASERALMHQAMTTLPTAEPPALPVRRARL